MPLLYKGRVKEIASNKPNASTAFNLPDSAPASFRSFDAAYATGETMECYATNGTDWEEFIGTFTSGSPDTLARTTLLDSSTGSAIDWSAGGDVTLFVTPSAKALNQFSNLLEGVTPGGRLTLESGVPVSSTDQTAKSTLYYTPYVGNIISLWDGSSWYPVEFSETSISLSGLVSDRPYDVYAYLNSGVLALEILAWTSATARATAITLQDGRYCKSGDKTRLLLGAIYTTGTNTTEDTKNSRYVANIYNKLSRSLEAVATTNHTYTTASGREFNAGTGVTRGKFIDPIGNSDIMVGFTWAFQMATAGLCGYGSVNLNTTTGPLGSWLMSNPASNFRTSGAGQVRSILGYNYLTLLEYGAANVNFENSRAWAGIEC